MGLDLWVLYRIVFKTQHPSPTAWPWHPVSVAFRASSVTVYCGGPQVVREMCGTERAVGVRPPLRTPTSAFACDAATGMVCAIINGRTVRGLVQNWMFQRVRGTTTGLLDLPPPPFLENMRRKHMWALGWTCGSLLFLIASICLFW